jgi:hypothetical protein
MPRPIKSGLDYFSLDTTWDVKMKLVKAKFKLVGVGCIIELFKTIYSEGYALKWDEDTRLLFADENGLDLERLDEIVKFAIEKDVFDQGIFEREGYLTSHGIQARWLKISLASKRQNVNIERKLDLLRISSGYTPEETPKTPEETPEIPEFSTQSKVKEIKRERVYKDNLSNKECAHAHPRIVDSSSPPPPPISQEKSGYGILKNVILSPSEHGELCKLYRDGIVADYINRLGAHLEKTGKTYRSHYAAILDWLNRDNVEQRPTSWSSAQPDGDFSEPSPEAKAAIFEGAKAKFKLPTG